MNSNEKVLKILGVIFAVILLIAFGVYQKGYRQKGGPISSEQLTMIVQMG